MIKVKFCGLTRMEDIAAVNEIRPDYIGFVFAQSRRKIDEDTAEKLKAVLSSEITAVGVFVNETPEMIADLCRKRIIDAVQLHGDEGEEYICNLKRMIENPVIKAVRVSRREDIQKAQKLPCDYFLLDTYDPHQYGGGGKVFDWSLIEQNIGPFFLAGGLTLDNVESALKSGSPYCLDISSGIETNGVKDPRKMRAIMEKIRSVG